MGNGGVKNGEKVLIPARTHIGGFSVPAGF